MTIFGFERIVVVDVVCPISDRRRSSSIQRSLITFACLEYDWKRRMFVNMPSSRVIASMPDEAARVGATVTDLNLMTAPS